MCNSVTVQDLRLSTLIELQLSTLISLRFRRFAIFRMLHTYDDHDNHGDIDQHDNHGDDDQH